MVGVLSAHGVTSSDAHASGFVVGGSVDVEVHDILAGLVIVKNLGSLYNAVRAQISVLVRSGEESAFVGPFNQVLRRIAVHVLKESAVCFILSYHVVGSIDFTKVNLVYQNTREMMRAI